MGDGSGLRYQGPNTKKYDFACVIADATACCSQGIEFVPDGDYTYPELNSSITVSGIFATYYEEGVYRYCRLIYAKMG